MTFQSISLREIRLAYIRVLPFEKSLSSLLPRSVLFRVLFDCLSVYEFNMATCIPPKNDVQTPLIRDSLHTYYHARKLRENFKVTYIIAIIYLGRNFSNVSRLSRPINI